MRKRDKRQVSFFSAIIAVFLIAFIATSGTEGLSEAEAQAVFDANMFSIFAFLFKIFVIGILIIFSFRLLRWYLKKWHFIKLANSFHTIDDIIKKYRKNPTQFEEYVASLYHNLGFGRITVTPPSNDGGKDIVMYKDTEKYVVEVKLYAADNKIGREKIQKLHSAMIDSKADRAIFVTTSDFTAPARDYAKKFDIDLVNGLELVELIQSIKQ